MNDTFSVRQLKEMIDEAIHNRLENRPVSEIYFKHDMKNRLGVNVCNS